MYNHKIFVIASKVSRILNDNPSNCMDYLAFQTHKDMSYAINKYIILLLTINNSNIVKSKYKGIFIHYTHDSTINKIWYLLQVDKESTLKINPLCTHNGK